MSGPLAFVGGDEWQDGCSFDRELLDASGADEVVLLPTAAAFEQPERAVEHATRWFGDLGARVEPLMVLRRADGMADDVVAAVRRARFLYLSGGSALHLRSVLKESPLWEALVAAWHDGAVVAGSSAGAMVLAEPMVDPRGGAFTVGLGLVTGMAVVPHHDQGSPEQLKRTLDLADSGMPVAAIDERTALIREADGEWRVAGAGGVRVIVDGAEAGLDALPR